MKWIDIPPMWLLAALVIAWCEGLVMARAANGLVYGLGSVLLIAGLVLIVGAVVQMFIARTTPIPHMQPAKLVATGFFGLSRNPIYLGDLLVLAGCCLRWEAYGSLILIPVLAWVLTQRFIQPEEVRLRDAFGTCFETYAARTRRWI